MQISLSFLIHAHSNDNMIAASEFFCSDRLIDPLVQDLVDLQEVPELAFILPKDAVKDNDAIALFVLHWVLLWRVECPPDSDELAQELPV